MQLPIGGVANRRRPITPPRIRNKSKVHATAVDNGGDMMRVSVQVTNPPQLEEKILPMALQAMLKYCVTQKNIGPLPSQSAVV